MKKSLILLGIAGLLIGCNVSSSVCANGGNINVLVVNGEKFISCNANSSQINVNIEVDNTTVGNGTKTINVSPFNSIEIQNGSFEVTISENKAQSVQITTDENIISKITTIVKDGVLIVSSSKGYTTMDSIKLILSAQEI